MGKAFLQFSERIHGCSRKREVLECLGRMAHEVLGGFTTILYLREGQSGASDTNDTGKEGDSDLLRPYRSGEEFASDDTLSPLPEEALQRIGGPAILTRKKLEADTGAELGALQDLFESMNASFLAMAAIGERGILVVVERRTNRPLDDEDHFFLRSLAHTAEERLSRVR